VARAARLRVVDACRIVVFTRILVLVKFPIEPFNTYVKGGSAGARVQKIRAEAKFWRSRFTGRVY